MVSVIIAATVGFLLGILLMIFLMAGRAEENLVDWIEKNESLEPTSSRESDGSKEAAGTIHEEGIPPG